MMQKLHMDVVIFGGGAAGLWLLDELDRAGINAILLEAHELGRGQTIASQGIIHGGLKYSLAGLFSTSAKAIREMPLIWRRCLAGELQPDLSHTRIRAEFCYLWQTKSVTSKLAMIGARKGLRVAPVKIPNHERPLILQTCPGTAARLDEQVIEPSSFLSIMRQKQVNRIMKIDAGSGLEFRFENDVVSLISLINPDSGEPLDLQPGVVVFAAGEGNASLRERCGLSANAMQRRPLHMVMARGNVHELNGHCVDGTKTRVTITTTQDTTGQIIWQLGGQVSEDGVQMDPPQLIKHAREELIAVLPGIDFSSVEWGTYRVDRAEAVTVKGQRPDHVYAKREGNIITAWPTKLALVPELTRRVMELIPERSQNKSDVDLFRDWPRPVVALPPWETQKQWISDL